MTVSTLAAGADIGAALVKSADGDTLLLVAGGAYPSFRAVGLVRKNVTVRSADPAKPAKVAGFELGTCSGFAFEDFAVGISSRTLSPIQIVGGGSIQLTRLDVFDAPGSARGSILIRFATGVTLDGCRVHDMGGGVRVIFSPNTTIRNNDLHDFQGDGIQCQGSGDILITGNRISDIYSKAGDHPDAIQFLTAGTTVAISNITITDNVITRGKGMIAQGIFMGDEMKLPYQDVTITGNAIVGAMFNGIRTRAVNLVIDGNLVLPYADMNSWIMVDQPSIGKVTNNTAAQVTAGAPMTVSGNTMVKAAAVGDVVLLAAWKARNTPAPVPAPPPASPPASPPPPATDWQALAAKWQAEAEAEALEIAKLNATLTAEQLADRLARDQAVADLAQRDADLAAAASSAKALQGALAVSEANGVALSAQVAARQALLDQIRGLAGQ